MIISLLLRELKERIAKERNPEKLQELVLGINRLLDAIEAQLAKVEEQKSTANQHEEDVFFRYSGWFRSGPLLDSSGAPSHHQC